MGTIAPTATFEERVTNRIRDDIGSLMTDEELKKLIETAIERIFFKERVITDRWGNTVVGTSPSVFQEVVQKAVEAKFKEAVNQYVLDHADVFAAQVDAAIGKGFLRLVTEAFDQKVGSAMYSFGAVLKQQLGVQ